MRTHPPDAQTVSIEEAAIRLGISRTLAYELAKRDALPAPVIRLGRRMVVSRAALDLVLGTAPRRGGDDATEAA